MGRGRRRYLLADLAVALVKQLTRLLSRFRSIATELLYAFRIEAFASVICRKIASEID